LAHKLASVHVSHEEWFEAERLWFYDYLQRTYTDDSEGGGHITYDGIKAISSYTDSDSIFETPSAQLAAVSAASLPALSVLIAPRDEMRRVYDELMDQAVLDMHKPLWEYDDQRRSAAKFEKIIMSSPMNQLRYLPIKIFMPALSSVRKVIQSEAGSRDGVMIGIALELYRRRHGDWPAALADLSPMFLPSVPVDRLTGKPLRYVLTEGGPVVYSLGVDGDDDGGRPPVESNGKINNNMASPRQMDEQTRHDNEHDGDWVLWPMPESH